MSAAIQSKKLPSVRLLHGDCLEIMPTLAENSVHAVICDPPFSSVEFSRQNIEQLRAKQGGNWRQPRKHRNPTPRILSRHGPTVAAYRKFLQSLSFHLLRLSVPGAHAVVASSPIFLHEVASQFVASGWEVRTTIIRINKTLRGGDRPKGAHLEFPDCSVLPRSHYEPWLLLRKPIQGTVAENLRSYGTGALRRATKNAPFCDLISFHREAGKYGQLRHHPTQKPIALIEFFCQNLIPFSGATIIDPTAGSMTSAVAALRTGRNAICIERDAEYYRIGSERVAAEKERIKREKAEN